jgi:hypothetical protein
MKKRWNIPLAAVAIGTMLLSGGIQALADESDGQTTAVTAAANNNNLTAVIQTAVKSMSVDPTPSGSNRIAAVIRLYNSGSVKVRIPDYELRAKTKEGLEYKLAASSGNVKTLEPKEVAELVYVSEFESKASISVAGLSFVKIDEYSYPKIETNLLTLPLGSEVWYGSDNGAASLKTLAWGQTFTIPGLNSQLTYTPAGFSMQHTDKGVTALITMLAENPGSGSETIPDFRIDARADKKKYTGKRTEESSIELAVGEKKYIHYAIAMENNSSPSSLIVMTTDNFIAAGTSANTASNTSSTASGTSSVSATGSAASTKAAIDIGRVAIAVQGGEQANSASNASYSIGNPIMIDPLSSIVDNTDVSLMEMHINQNPGDSSKTAIAKFMLVNKNSKPIPTPSFETELTGAGGATYSGDRQTNVVATLNPGLGYIISYSYTIPVTEEGKGLVLTLLDTKTATPYKIAAASVVAPVQQETESNTLLLYPFEVEFTDYTVSTNYMTTSSAYTYKLKLTLDIKQKENVTVDKNFSKLRFEVVDKLGRVLGTADQVLVGDQKLMSGTQNIVTSDIKSEQFEFPITTNVYELIETANGQAKRFLKTLN